MYRPRLTPSVRSFATLTFVFLLLASCQAFAQCTLNTTNPSVTICTPTNNATVSSPVHVVAGTTSSTTVQRIEIWVDGSKVYSTSGGKLDTSVPIASGTHKLTVQAYNGTYFKSTIYITVSGSSSTCTANTTDPSVTICSPANNATVTSPVTVAAVTTSSKTVQYMQIYVDGSKVYQVSANKLSTSVSMSSGTHRLTVQAYNGTYFKSTEYITVSGGTAAVSVSISPTSANVSPGGTQQFTAKVSNATDTSVKWYVDGVQGGNSTVGTISTSGLYTAPGTNGTHTVKAVSNADTTKSASASVTVGSSTGCTATGTSPSVTVCTPTDGSTVTSPVHITAATISSTPVQYMQIYVDGTKKYQVNANSVDTSVSMTGGQHRLTVQAYNGSTVFKKTEYITVSTAPTVSVSVSPSSATIALGATQQFTATVSNATDTSVTWSVDGVNGGNSTVGTIDSSGLYTAPNTDSTHTVKATSNADNTASDTASVTVGNPPKPSFSGMFTYKYGNQRLGANTSETVLTPSNVNSSTFGKLFTYSVDGYVYAMPLYVPQISIGGSTRNVVYIATEHNSVYAFDADGSTTSPLWKKTLTSSTETTIPQGDVGSTIYPEIGITGTPVIDPNTKTLYAVANTKASDGTYHQKLHALDILTGNEKFGGPVEIKATVKGTGDGTDGNGNVPFQAKIQLQRPALTLYNGVVYIAWASHGDNGPYHGWVIGYNAGTLAQVAVHNNSPNARRGGIWMSGGGLAVDANGGIYYMSGNGTFTASSGGNAYGDSFVRLNSGLGVVDYFTPFDQSNMNAHDLDLGVGAPTALPDQPGSHPHLLVGAGKTASIYLVDRDNMGHFNSSNNDQIVQYLPNALASHCHEQPVYWNGKVYFSTENGPMYKFTMNNGLLSTSAQQTSTLFDFPGPNPVISANGTSNGILWAIDKPSSGGAVLRAYDANDLGTQLYNSNQAGTRDTLTTAVKFVPPTVANGKVYVPLKGKVAVFGLLK